MLLKDLKDIILDFAGPTQDQLHKFVMQELDARHYIATRFYKNPRRFGRLFKPFPFYMPAREFWIRRVFGRQYEDGLSLEEWIDQWQEIWLDQRTRWAERICSSPNVYGVIPFTWALGPHELNLRDWTLWEDY